MKRTTIKRRLASRRNTTTRRRRGVLLIVVLSILVLFALIGLTFVVVAGQYRSSSTSAARAEIFDDEGRELTYEAFFQLLRGTNNQQSYLFEPDSSSYGGLTQCLLEDLYGPESIVATLSADAETTDGGNPLYDFVKFNASGPLPAVGNRPVTFDDKEDYYTGQVITMMDGPAGLISSRIVKYTPSGGTSATFVVERFTDGQNATPLPRSGNQFIINGRPLNRYMGNGSNELPHADEDWDAPDVANPFLFYQPANATTTANTIASFVDRAIIDTNNDGTPDTRLDVNNPPTPVPLVVDNDRDGLMDSVWIDTGLPVKTTPDGRRIKPLVAYLCQDMDGRLNLNAHSSYAQTDSQYSSNITNFWANVTSNSQSAKNISPRGLGAGPADVALTELLTNNDVYLVLSERYKSKISGDGFASSKPGYPTGANELFLFETPGLPDNFETLATVAAGYGSRTDLHGIDGIGVDYTGNPIITSGHANNAINEVTQSPYNINLNKHDGRDSPFTAEDLERLLRWTDTDSLAMSQRLLTIPGGTQFVNDMQVLRTRRSLTTHSFNVPVPGLPGDSKPGHIADVFKARMGGNFTNAHMKAMLPPGVLRGGKMDLNRMFGNFLDDNGDGVVDNEAELSATAQPLHANVYGSVPGYPTPNGDFDNSGNTSSNLLSRHMFARHLYCLMLLLSEDAYRDQFFGSDNTLTDDQKKMLTRRRIAQWAINVVDFRDPDAIMTPFEFDLEPFDANGWNCDGIVNPTTNITTDGTTSRQIYQPDNSDNNIQLIWGCEYPDLIITETFAMHDRRVRDTQWDDRSDDANEDPVMDPNGDRGSTRIHPEYATDPMKKGDKDLDQTRIPKGDMVVELYCARSRARNNEVFPRELYTYLNSTPGSIDAVLDLKRTVPSGNFPIWRMAISVPHHSYGSGATYAASSPQTMATAYPNSVSFQPEDMSVLPGALQQLPIDRYVWFGSAPPVANPDTFEPQPGNTFYNKANASTLLRPAEYAVIGSRKQIYFGSRSPDDTSDDSADTNLDRDPDTRLADQMLDLAKGGGETTWFYDHGGNNRYPLQSGAAITEVRPPLTLTAVIDPPTTGDWSNVFSNVAGENGPGLNVSEPLPSSGNYYDPPTQVSTHTGRKDMYGVADPALTPQSLFPDEPFDNKAGKPLQDAGFFGQNSAIIDNYRSIFLQRLANPLADWNAVTNPYISVDWLPIDLYVFNGEDKEPADLSDDPISELDPDAKSSNAGKFSGIERTPSTKATPFDPTPLASEDNLWEQRGMPFGFPPFPPTGPAPVNGVDEYLEYKVEHSLGYLNTKLQGKTVGPIPAPGPKSGDVEGDPPKPFPWVYWPNRPLINHQELMLVPSSSPNRLLHEFNVKYVVSSGSVYDPGKPGAFRRGAPFNHLLNFYREGITNDPNAGAPPHFYRLMEFVQVPSRFAGTRSWYYPNDNSSTNVPGLQPPFNNFSRFRDPGLININTIPAKRVWRAALGTNPTLVPETDAFNIFAEIDASRQGTPDSLGRFTNPFRGPYQTGSSTSNASTLLRPNAAGTDPLAWQPRVQPDYAKSTHHAYFEYQGLLRGGNILTTRSNVFAVWVTVGYFEVDAANNLVREYGSDTGEVRRHRAFFIVDRSIPVAYQRGQNHNVRDAVLLDRYIE